MKAILSQPVSLWLLKFQFSFLVLYSTTASWMVKWQITLNQDIQLDV